MKDKLTAKQVDQPDFRRLRIISRADPNGAISYVSNQFLKVRGFSRKELLEENRNIIRHQYKCTPAYKRKSYTSIESPLQIAALTIEQALQQATSLSQAGQFQDAEQLYDAILHAHSNSSATRDCNADGNAPTPREIDQLVVLFNEDNHVEMENQAFLLIKRYPASGLAWQAFGAVLQAQGKSALHALRKATELLPGDAEAHSNLGNALHDSGQLEDAVANYRRALEIKPDFAEAHNNLGNALQGLGKLHGAVASYHQALELMPDFAEAHNNLGNALHDFGQLDEAVASYCRALEIKPDYAEAHNNLGNAFYDLDRLDKAEGSYRQALKIKPDYSDALNNLALLFYAQGKSMMALDTIKQSLRVKETEKAKKIFVVCIKRLRFAYDDEEVRIIMARALTESWGRPNELAQIGIDLVKLNPDIVGYVARSNKAWPLRLSEQDLFGSSGLATLATDTLLCALLDSTPICDIEIERFLTMARHAMLEAATRMIAAEDASDTALSFYSALARQCFVNEYVFPHSDDEIEKTRDLWDSLLELLEDRNRVPALWPLAVAAYFPLHTLPFAHRLLDRLWPEEVSTVLTQQVREPEEERQLFSTIPRLTNIEDEVSLLVQKQYEENPYPRWIKTAPAEKAKNIIEYLCQKFPLAHFSRQNIGGDIDILIAGCGTGQHSIETAQQFQCRQVLAVDLSISSLAYAKRKSREMGFTLIEYAQADLLKLGSLCRSFEIIESSGVLHHLADPWIGWKTLLSLLRPDGFMKLGLYSEMARRNIVKAHAIIAEQGYGASNSEIRRCRQDLVDLDKIADFGVTLNSSDFFCISTCRDLLFHVQEHHMTLIDIEAFLRDNKLTFVGFEIEGNILHAYRKRFPDDRAATSLGQWHIFENENPDTFANMYQFWIQKMP